MDVTLRHLQYLLAVADQGSVKAAAQACHVSPSSVSLALDDLERALGAQVTIRSRRSGTVLTPAGRQAVGRARRILGEVDELVTSSQSLQTEHVGTLRLGCPINLSVWLLPRLLDRFSRDYPQVQVRLSEGGPHAIQEQLVDGALDAAFIQRSQTWRELDTTPIVPLHVYAVLWQGHPLAVRDTVSLVDLKDEPAILIGYEPAMSNARAMFRAAGVEPWIRWTGENVEMVRSLVARRLGYSLMVGRPLGGSSYEGLPLIHRRLKESATDNFVDIATPRNLTRTKVTEALISVCQQEFSPLAPPTEYSDRQA
ncbi:DNA-binding transcriptional LysR family regulator [Propionibacteriaceae bacterium ES.041]|nr:DNA-binding transcriptional LysR family regulator [Propionibacteriaceae bacterium ES.041]